MSFFAPEDEQSLYFSRLNPDDPLSTHSAYAFELDGLTWPTVEHYYQAMKFTSKSYQLKISEEPEAKKASIMGRTRFKSTRKDWKKVQVTMMTRAVYTKCKTHSEVAKKLIETGESKLVESSQYDYFWGCGRDKRGDNHYGLVLMRVRHKLLAELKAEAEGESNDDEDH